MRTVARFVLLSCVSRHVVSIEGWWGVVSNIGDVRGGMDVYTADGDLLGMVVDVLLSRSDTDTPDVRGPITLSLPPDAVIVPDKARIAPTQGSTSYFTVAGEDDAYYVPFEAITILFPGQNVTLDSTVEECAARYHRAPH
jgi:hypothetical protein